MSEQQLAAQDLPDSSSEIAIAIRAVPVSIPHARAMPLLVYACRQGRM
jgi:hypothetical protein